MAGPSAFYFLLLSISCYGYEQQLMKVVANNANNAAIQVYHDGNTQACRSLDPIGQQYCGRHYVSPATAIRAQAKLFRTYLQTFNHFRPLISDYCANVLKEVICKSVFPRCTPDMTQVTWFNFTSACSKLPRACANTPATAFMSLCDTNVYPHTYSLSTCVKPTAISYEPGYCPSLPNQIRFPAWTLPLVSSRYTTAVAVKDNLMHSTGILPHCLDLAVTLICQSIPFCSPDGQRLLIGITKQKCRSEISCLTGIGKLLFNATLDCELFPESDAQQESISSSQGYGEYADIDVVPTTASNIMISTTKVSNHGNVNSAQSYPTYYNLYVAVISIMILLN